MSNFACRICGRTQFDSDRGYIAGCGHYPPQGRLRGKMVVVWFGGDGEKPTKAFYVGAWYKSESARLEGRAVHPVEWEAEHKIEGETSQ